MPSGTFDDQAQLAQLFQQAYSPVTNYSQGALALAMQDRQAKDRLNQARQVEQIREEGENQRAAAANAMVLQRMKDEFKLKSDEEQEKERRAMVAKANETGADLPSDASFDTASKAYVDNRGKTYIEANRAAGVALSGILRHTGQDPKAFASRVAGLIADDPMVAKEMTVAERELIRNNPDKLTEFRKQFAAGKKAKYEAYVQAMNQVTSTVTTEFEKEAASKPELARATADYRLALDRVKSLQNGFVYNPKVETEAMDAYAKASAPPPAPPSKQPNFGLPTPRVNGAVAGPPIAPAATPFVAPETATPGGFLTQGAINAGRAVINKGPDFINSLIYPSTNAAPAAPTDPSELSNLRLRKFLQDSAAQNSALFPTAYPPYNTNQFTAPLSPSPTP
jgi:hypothetical protein